MKETKSISQTYLELEKNEDKLITNSLNKYYLNNIIAPYKKNSKLIDLHTHTTYSDGDLSPIDLIILAIKNNIKTLSITDHDTLEGIKNLDKNNSLIIDSGINIINGIELSAKVNKGRMHILGYDIDIYNKNLNNTIDELKNNSLYSILSLIVQIKNDYNIIFPYNDIKQLINSDGNLGRPNIAKLCVKNGYAFNNQDAFDKYLIDSYEKIRNNNNGISYQECINLILDSGGIPVLAHPKTLKLNDEELFNLLKDMISIGLMGIEVYHSSHTREETIKYLKLAKELNLLISGGSDYHGPIVKPDIELGNLKIKKLSILDKIKMH